MQTALPAVGEGKSESIACLDIKGSDPKRGRVACNGDGGFTEHQQIHIDPFLCLPNEAFTELQISQDASIETHRFDGLCCLSFEGVNIIH